MKTLANSNFKSTSTSTFTLLSDCLESYSLACNSDIIISFKTVDLFEVLKITFNLCTIDKVEEEFLDGGKVKSYNTNQKRSWINFPYGEIKVISTSTSTSTYFNNTNLNFSSGKKADPFLYHLPSTGNYGILTNDNKLRKKLEEANRIVLGSVGALAFAVGKGLLKLEEAHHKHDEMRNLGFRVYNVDFKYWYENSKFEETYLRLLNTLSRKV